MKLKDDDQLLDQEFRKLVIDEIHGWENAQRKREHLRRYEVYKDKTVKWVLEALAAEGLKLETIEQMKNRASNISICKKVVNKLARSYAGGTTRDAGDETATQQVSTLAQLLHFDDRMRKSDRYRELHKNGLIQIVPERDPTESTAQGEDLYNLKVRPLSPWQYDVIEDAVDKETPRCVILSDWAEQNEIGGSVTEDTAGRHGGAVGLTDRKDGVLADAPSDAGMQKVRTYIWWSNKYHFTTNEKGEILSALSPEKNENPIGLLPFVNNAEEQDGQFWATGGDDIVDGSILVNKTITDMLFIAYIQGYGQFVVTGKNLPKSFTMGPNNALIFDYDAANGDPKPEVTVVTADPPLEAWMRAVEQYVALLLTTNNLSPSNVSAKLDASTFPSGIAMLVEMSEATNDIEDKQKQYVAIERAVWERIRRWHALYSETRQLTPAFADVKPLADGTVVTTRFNEVKAVATEKERLENIRLRKDLGINERVDLIIKDNPDMSVEDAKAKLLRIDLEAKTLIKGAVGTDLEGGDQVEQPEATAAAPEGEVVGGGVEGAVGVPGLDVQKLALNGAQVSSIVEIVAQVGAGLMPKETARSILAAAFGLDEATITSIIGPVVVKGGGEEEEGAVA